MRHSTAKPPQILVTARYYARSGFPYIMYFTKVHHKELLQTAYFSLLFFFFFLFLMWNQSGLPAIKIWTSWKSTKSQETSILAQCLMGSLLALSWPTLVGVQPVPSLIRTITMVRFVQGLDEHKLICFPVKKKKSSILSPTTLIFSLLSSTNSAKTYSRSKLYVLLQYILK